jgi:hypothetical protein
MDSTEHNSLMLGHALRYALIGWEVFPLRGKIPAIRGGQGLKDATTDPGTVSRWWGKDYPGANIGLRIPAGVFVLDSDPRIDGHHDAHLQLIERHGPLPMTLTNISGRLDGGCHRFYRRPPGKLSAARLGPGFDLKDARGGYVVAPPSIHPDTGNRYLLGVVTAIADPGWLTDLIVVADKPKPQPRQCNASHRFLTQVPRRAGLSPAEAFESAARWVDILEPHGWTCLDGDGEHDGDRWLHPTATSPCSATIRHGNLFVYSPNTPFEPTSASNPHGYKKFRAYGVLNHNGDLSAAAAAVSRVRT